MTIKENVAVPIIIALSVIIPSVVAILLFGLSNLQIVDGLEKGTLPKVNAIINSAVTVLLIVGLYFIKKRNIKAHKNTMLTALVFSVLFLVSYVIQHAQFESTKYPKDAAGYYPYLFILLTHILLAAAVVPLALFSIYRGLNRQDDKHRAIARWTLPIWLYVSITGVVVYVMISPYY